MGKTRTLCFQIKHSLRGKASAVACTCSASYLGGQDKRVAVFSNQEFGFSLDNADTSQKQGCVFKVLWFVNVIS